MEAHKSRDEAPGYGLPADKCGEVHAYIARSSTPVAFQEVRSADYIPLGNLAPRREKDRIAAERQGERSDG